MRIRTVGLALLLVLPSPALAGEIYGHITASGRSVGEGVTVDIRSPAKTYSATTDANGSYRVFVRERGKCTLTVHYKHQSPSADILSSGRSLRYDWILESKDGRYALRRR